MVLSNNRKGFTFIELVVVAIIIAVLAAIAVQRYYNVIEPARGAKAWSTLSDIVTAEKRYYLENDNYTTTLTDLDIYDADPSTADDDFTHSFVDPWARANRVSATGGRLSYRLNLDGTRESIAGTY